MSHLTGAMGWKTLAAPNPSNTSPNVTSGVKRKLTGHYTEGQKRH